ncbi:hypothetical protein LXL04_027041 [Taraxacum kok-saghyz]
MAGANRKGMSLKTEEFKVLPCLLLAYEEGPKAGDELKNRTATAEEISELVLEEAIADKRAQRAVQLSGKICDLFERAYRKDRTPADETFQLEARSYQHFNTNKNINRNSWGPRPYRKRSMND